MGLCWHDWNISDSRLYTKSIQKNLVQCAVKPAWVNPRISSVNKRYKRWLKKTNLCGRWIFRCYNSQMCESKHSINCCIYSQSMVQPWLQLCYCIVCFQCEIAKNKWKILMQGFVEERCAPNLSYVLWCFACRGSCRSTRPLKLRCRPIQGLSLSWMRLEIRWSMKAILHLKP